MAVYTVRTREVSALKYTTYSEWAGAAPALAALLDT